MAMYHLELSSIREPLAPRIKGQQVGVARQPVSGEGCVVEVVATARSHHTTRREGQRNNFSKLSNPAPWL